MRRLVVILLLLIISVWGGVEMARHPGYVLVVYQPWMIQMPLWFALIMLLIILGLCYIFLGGLDRLQFWWFRLWNYLHRRREQRSYSQTQRGLLALIEGHWHQAERLLLASAKQNKESLINYLFAAKAAQEQHADDRCARYLQKAHRIAPDAEMAIGLMQAELAISNARFEHALATLNHLHPLSPKHPRVLQLLEKVYVHTGDWQHLRLLLPYLRKAKVLSAAQADMFEKNIYGEIVSHATPAHLEALQLLWRNIPRKYRRHPEVIFAYVRQRLRFPQTEEIEKLIRYTLKYHWHAGLVKVYADLVFVNLNRQLVIAGSWLKKYGPHVELLLLLAQLCEQEKLWGKAKAYYEKCWTLNPNAEVAMAYGKLLEQLGEKEAAIKIYRDGLAASS